MHEQLLCDIILNFLQTEAHILQWRHHFKTYSNDRKVSDGSISGHFEYLEERGILTIGNYDILKRIFNRFNTRVEPFIDERLPEIEEALENNQNESWYIYQPY